MTKKKTVSQKLRIWIEARQRFHLSHAHIQMARELGLNSKKFGKLANHRQEPWKAPLPEFIESLYLKRFNKVCPDRVLSIEERAKEMDRKREEKKRKKEAKSQSGNLIGG